MATGTFTYVDVAALVAGSSVLAAFVNQGVTAIREWYERRRQSAFSALYLAIGLESYASECSTAISESETFDASDESAGAPHGNVPDLADFSSSIDWKPLGIRATTKAMSFAIEVKNTQAMLRGLWEFSDEEDVVPQVREEAARLGSKALLLASDLRKQRGVAPVEYEDYWNVREFLDRKLGDYMDRRRKRDEANRQFNAELFADAVPQQPEAVVDADQQGVGNPSPN